MHLPDAHAVWLSGAHEESTGPRYSQSHLTLRGRSSEKSKRKSADFEHGSQLIGIDFIILILILILYYEMLSEHVFFQTLERYPDDME